MQKEHSRTYKQSGYAWIGSIPSDWDTGRLRWLSRRYAGGTPDKKNEAFWENGTIPWLNSGAVNQSTITEPSALITEDAYNSSSAKWIPKDALVMALAGQGKTKGMVAQLAITATCNQSMAAIVPSGALFSRFLFWWLTTNYQNIRNLAGGDDRDGLNLELIGDISVPLPTIIEQRAIASFLDRETAKIDSLVAEQQRLIELLKEKRQAVISRAVVKGLDPAATMRDSGVEWFGDVPAHWKIVRIKHLLQILTDYTANGSFASLAENVTYLSEGYSRLVRLTDLRDSLENDGIYVDAAAHAFLKKSELFGGEVLIANVGAYAGYCCLMPRGAGKATLGPNMYLMRFNPNFTSNQFALLSLMAPSCQEQLKLSSTATAQPKLNKDDVKDCFVALPPLSEQAQIIEFIESMNEKTDSLVAQAETAIGLLMERRAALIAAAVTGKIDVRGLVETVTPTSDVVAA